MRVKLVLIKGRLVLAVLNIARDCQRTLEKVRWKRWEASIFPTPEQVSAPAVARE